MGEMINYRSNGGSSFNDDRPEVYNEAAAMLAWDRTLTFLHDKLRSA
jgi:dienelactone hydrolase